MKKLPIGEQDFSNLRSKDYVYIDKTEYIHNILNDNGSYFFLSRPRRFGKSLLLTTIRALFEGEKELFEGLFIYDKHDWQIHPVILLDMGGMDMSSLESLRLSLTTEMTRIAEKYGLGLTNENPIVLFSSLIFALQEKTGQQVVLLTDEYDKPILDNIQDLHKAQKMREFLRNFYTIIKSASSALRFVLLTGVSKITQTSIFSGLNNLFDITLHDTYAGICGYTQQDVEQHFKEHIEELAVKQNTDIEETLANIKHWYNGYSWDGQTFVYNPFSVLLLLAYQRFLPHWFSTGTPSFLIKLLKENPDFSPLLETDIVLDESFVDGQSLERLSMVPLCFQTGYLTVKKREMINGQYYYHLQIPNFEVKTAFTKEVLAAFTSKSNYEVVKIADQIKDAFVIGDTESAIYSLRILFSQISYNTHIPSEAHYHALFQLAMIIAGVDHQAESYSNRGRADSILKFNNRIYVIEIKYTAAETGLQNALAEAMTQIKNKRYYEPFLNQGRRIHLLALAFTKGEMGYQEEMI